MKASILSHRNNLRIKTNHSQKPPPPDHLNLMPRPIQNNNSIENPIMNHDNGYTMYRFPGKLNPENMVLFPKRIIQRALSQTVEFQYQPRLHHYLSWTHKIQIIKTEFRQFLFIDDLHPEIAIFNTELHAAQGERILYVIATINDEYDTDDSIRPKWIMSKIMTSQQIYSSYGIPLYDLPKPSRAEYGYWRQEIIKQSAQILQPHDQKELKWSMNLPDLLGKSGNEAMWKFNEYDIKMGIKHSLEIIKNGSGSRCTIDLIPVLRVLMSKPRVYMNTLIPVKIKNEWIGIDYKIMSHDPYSNELDYEVIKIYDVEEMINAAALRDPGMIQKLSWLEEVSVYPSHENQVNIAEEKNEDKDQSESEQDMKLDHEMQEIARAYKEFGLSHLSNYYKKMFNADIKDIYHGKMKKLILSYDEYFDIKSEGKQPFVVSKI